jgi:hypothetical protein
MASKIGKGEWKILYVIVGTIDFIQFFLIEGFLIWAFGIGAGINEIVDPIVGSVLLGYFELRGVRILTDVKRLMSMVGTEAAAAVTGGVAQLWILDVWYIHGDVKREEAEAKAQAAAESMEGPPNRNGTRRPNRRVMPANRNKRREARNSRLGAPSEKENFDTSDEISLAE